MPQATSTQSKKSKSKSRPESGGEEAGPSAQERAESGIKLAQHVQTALTGGKIRKAFALWGAAKQLRVAAAGTGGVVKKHPLATALIGGGLAATAIYLVARSMDAQDESAGDEGEDEDNGDREQAEDSASDEAREEQDDQEQEDEEDEGEEDEPSNRNSRNGARQRAGSRGR
jgi:hypothetical protein